MAEAAGKPLYNTIYDVIVANPEYYTGIHKKEAGLSELYDEVSRLLGIFALADLRHDFGRGVDIFILMAKKTIGQLFCNYVAAAFYAPASERHKDLLKYLQESYDEYITSNKAAITFFKSEMDGFFLNRMNVYRVFFAKGSYMRYYDSCALETFDYDTPAKKDAILSAISPAANRSNQAILVDAMIGNPMEKLFNGAGAGARVNYLYNFASTMDAASKAAENAHTYMNTCVQINPLHVNPIVSNIHRAYTSFGAQTDIVSFGLNAGIWETTAKVTANGTAIRDTFSVQHKASVNNMGLILVRGKGAAGGAGGQIAGQLNIFEILVQHLFKSLGDRLQDFSVSDAGMPLITYSQVVDIRSGTRVGAASGTVADKNILVFTNDEMNNFQLYMMRVNSIYTGFATVTPYVNRETVALTVETVQKYFVDRAASFHAALNAIPAPLLIINNPDTLRATFHEALTRQNIIAAIVNNPLLSLLKSKVPSKAEINTIVSAETFGSYTNIMTDAIIDYLRRVCMPKEMSNKFIKVTFSKYYQQISDLNRTLYLRQGMATDEDYLIWFTIVNGLTAILKTLGLTPINAYLASNGIILLYKNIKSSLYVSGRLIAKLTKGVDADIVAEIIALPIVSTILSDYDTLINKKIEIKPAISASSDTYFSILCLHIVNGINYESLMKQVFEPINVVMASKDDIKAGLDAALPIEEAIVAPPLPPPPPPPPPPSPAPAKFTRPTKSKLTKKTIPSIKVRKTKITTKEIKNMNVQRKLRNSRAKSRIDRQLILSKKRAVIPKLTTGDYHPRAEHIRALIDLLEIDGTIEAYSKLGSDQPVGFAYWRPISAIKEAYDAFTRYLASIGGGGTKSRERESKLAQLCIMKLHCMAVNIHTNPVYAVELLVGSDLITTIIADMKSISKSKSRPVLLQSSLSRIEEEGTQTGGGRSQTQTIMQKSQLVIHLKGSKAEPDMTLASGTKVKILSGTQAKSLLEQRLAAFLWLGFNRSRETLRLEAEISASLISIDEFTADAHYDLFWAPLFSFAQQSYEFFAQKYENGLSMHFSGQSRSPLKRSVARLRTNQARVARTRKFAKPT